MYYNCRNFIFYGFYIWLACLGFICRNFLSAVKAERSKQSVKFMPIPLQNLSICYIILYYLTRR